MIISCTHSSRNDHQVSTLININKNKLLFLDFWAEMNTEEFGKIIEYENSKGNLVKGKFNLKYPTNYPFNYENSGISEISFRITKQDQGICLTYHDEVWDEIKPNLLPREGKKEGAKYNNIKDYLIKYFDSKYSIIKNTESSKIWKTKGIIEKIVLLEYSIDYFEIPKNGSAIIMNKEKNESKYKIAECVIKITYLLFDDYLKEQNVIKDKESLEMKKDNKEKENQKEEIYKNNEKL